MSLRNKSFRTCLPSLPAKVQEEKMKEWVKRYTSDVLVYCNGCERGLKIGGIQPIHIVELLAENL